MRFKLSTVTSGVVLLLATGCVSDSTSPILDSSGDPAFGALNDGQPKQEYSHASGIIAEIDYDATRLRVGEDDWLWANEQTKIKIDDFDGNPSFGDLAVDDFVEIEYRTPADEGMGFYANEIKVKDQNDDDEDDGEGRYYDWAEGYVTDLDADNMRFQIGEMWLWVDEYTMYGDHDDDDDEYTWSFDDIAVGVWVKARYHMTPDEEKGYYAKIVVIKPNHEFEWAEGHVTEVDADNMRFQIGDMWFWTDESTSYCDDDDYDDDEMCWSFDDIQVGVWVKTKYRTFLDEEMGYYAMKVIVKFEQARVEGYVDEIDGDGMALLVGDDWYWADEHTKIEIDGFSGDPTFGDIEVGDLVKIKYHMPAYEGKGFYAKEIEVKADS